MQSCFGYGTLVDTGFAKVDLVCIQVASFFLIIFYLERLKSMPLCYFYFIHFLKTKKSNLPRLY